MTTEEEPAEIHRLLRVPGEESLMKLATFVFLHPREARRYREQDQ